jgi:hypothetical protein
MRTSCLIVAALALGCSGMSYRPVQEASFDRLIDDGCKSKSDRFSLTAQVNSASRDTVVLWDGRDGSRTLAIRLPDQGIGSRTRGVFGKNRYELGVERLDELRASGTPVTFAMRCEGEGKAPLADRFSYEDNGQRIEFEF